MLESWTARDMERIFSINQADFLARQRAARQQCTCKKAIASRIRAAAKRGRHVLSPMPNLNDAEEYIQKLEGGR